MGCEKWVIVWLVFLSFLGGAGAAQASESDSPTYEKDIKPLFAKRCTACHRASKRSMVDISGGLALDSLEGVLAGSARDKVIVPRKSGDSELMRRLTDPDEDRRMPLQDQPLAPSQLELVARWIDAGMPRGAIPATPAKADRSLPRRVRFNRSLDVSLPTDVKLAVGSPHAPKGAADLEPTRWARCRPSRHSRSAVILGCSRSELTVR